MSTPLTTTDPAELANLARCFSACLPVGLQLPLRTLQLNNVAVIATNPVCSTPASPFLAGVFDIDNSSIQITWKANPHNTGSFVTGWIISWGTTPGGPYTSNSGVLPLTPRFYIASGLNSGTTYYFVVTAVTAIAGCTSVPSHEVSATTSGGPPPNGLLNGLVSYWKFDNVSALTTPDSVGANTLTLNAANSGVGGGIINGDLDIGAGGSYATHADNADFSPAANTSIAFSGWISASDYTNGGNTIAFCTKSDGAANGQYQLYIDPGTNRLAWVCFDTGANVNGAFLTPGKPVAGFHHVACGFDSPTKAVYAYYDGVFVFSVPLVTSSIQVKALDFRFGEWAAGGLPAVPNQRVDEFGMWHRTLSATDVTTLYNGGAGLPLSSFTT